jgi:hypothetical protein
MAPADVSEVTIERNMTTYKDFLGIADTPCEILHIAIRLDDFGGEFNAEPLTRQYSTSRNDARRRSNASLRKTHI